MEEDFTVPKWDYKEIIIDGRNLNKTKTVREEGFWGHDHEEENPDYYLPQLQELGKKGWEVCGIFTSHVSCSPGSSSGYYTNRVLLKRQSGYLRCERK